MKGAILFRFSIVYFLFFALPAYSATIVNLYGDKDGFGTGVAEDASFGFRDVVADDVEDIGSITDVWLHGPQTWTQTYDLTGFGTITSASLEIFTGGQGFSGTSSLYIDGDYVGELTDGDVDVSPHNYARLDTFDLATFLGSLDGATSLTVETHRNDDGWVLDYSQLTISNVPVPAAAWLFGSALLGLGAINRKRA